MKVEDLHLGLISGKIGNLVYDCPGSLPCFFGGLEKQQDASAGWGIMV